MYAAITCKITTWHESISESPNPHMPPQPSEADGHLLAVVGLPAEHLEAADE